MKIGIYSPYLNTLGGGERYVLTIAEHLSDNHSVSIFWDDDLTDKTLNRLSIDLKRAKFVDNIFDRKQFLLKKLIYTRQYDLLIFLSDGSLPFSLAKHNIIHFQRPFVGVDSRLNSLKLKNIDYIVCNSKFTKKYIDQNYKANSRVIYPPVETEEFSVGSKKKLIISVGRFHPFKKQKELVKAFLKLNNSYPSWQLLLIGGLLDQDNEYFEGLKREVKNANSIRLLPNESFDNLKKYYSQAEIYWHAAGFKEDEEVNPERMEHFGITTVEAMASGCAPIVYDGGGQREIIRHGENGYLWRTEEDLIKFTTEIIRNEKSKIKIRKEAIKDSKDYDKKVFIDKFDKLIKSLL